MSDQTPSETLEVFGVPVVVDERVPKNVLLLIGGHPFPLDLSGRFMGLLRMAHDEGYRHGYQNARYDIENGEELDENARDSFDLWLDEVQDLEAELPDPPEWRQTIAVDFDGVLHSYTTGWKDSLTVADPPVPGALEWLVELVETFDVVVHTCRLSFNPEERFHEDTPTHERLEVIRTWFRTYGLPDEVLEKLRFHTTRGKPHADVYVDDRGYRFTGRFPTVRELQGLVPWGKL